MYNTLIEYVCSAQPHNKRSALLVVDSQEGVSTHEAATKAAEKLLGIEGVTIHSYIRLSESDILALANPQPSLPTKSGLTKLDIIAYPVGFPATIRALELWVDEKKANYAHADLGKEIWNQHDLWRYHKLHIVSKRRSPQQNSGSSTTPVFADIDVPKVLADLTAKYETLEEQVREMRGSLSPTVEQAIANGSMFTFKMKSSNE